MVYLDPPIIEERPWDPMWKKPSPQLSTYFYQPLHQGYEVLTGLLSMVASPAQDSIQATGFQ